MNVELVEANLCLHCGSPINAGDFCDDVCKGYYETMLESESPTFEHEAFRLAEAVWRYARKAKISDANRHDLDALVEIAESVASFQQDDDPISMGWVRDDGRP